MHDVTTCTDGEKVERESRVLSKVCGDGQLNPGCACLAWHTEINIMYIHYYSFLAISASAHLYSWLHQHHGWPCLAWNIGINKNSNTLVLTKIRNTLVLTKYT